MMAFSESDLKIFAAGLAIGGKYNHTHGTLPRIEASRASGTYFSVFYVTLSCSLTAATIFYSTDGGTPTTIYTGQQIQIDTEGTHVIYAYALYGQGLSPMAKFTYILYVPKIITTDVIPLLGISDTETFELAYPELMDVADTLLTPSISDTVEIEIVG